MKHVTPLYLLSGPTASGKTAVAHALATRMGLRLLSVDSMMVYRGMDIGTAKPSDEDIQRYDYCGVNLVDPGDEFSVGKWVDTISDELDDRPTLAVGGTGLYFRALIDGLHPEPVPAKRNRTGGDVQELQKKIQELDPSALETLADPENPRRLERLLDWLSSEKPAPDEWARKSRFPIVVLRRPVDQLNGRIQHRATQMFADGLLEETAGLIEAGKLTGTASQAIGYHEAKAVLEGTSDRSKALEKLATRTRRYAKRQRTWFRNQMDSRWVDIEEHDSVDKLANRVAEIWEQTGPFRYGGDDHE